MAALCDKSTENQPLAALKAAQGEQFAHQRDEIELRGQLVLQHPQSRGSNGRPLPWEEGRHIHELQERKYHLQSSN